MAMHLGTLSSQGLQMKVPVVTEILSCKLDRVLPTLTLLNLRLTPSARTICKRETTPLVRCCQPDASLFQSAGAYPATATSILAPRFCKQAPGVVAGFTTRHFGNMSMSQLGAPSCDSFKQLEKEMDLAGVGWVLPRMVHGGNVMVVDSSERPQDCDGLVTSTPELLLCVTAADCGSVLLYDPVAAIIGSCHSGWKGTASGIASATVDVMRSQGAIPARMVAFVGPCISAEHFEVGEEVAEQFSEEFVVRRRSWPRPHIDLKAAIASQLRQAGVRDVEVHPGCTIADSDLFFSHRGSQGAPERMMAFIALRP